MPRYGAELVLILAALSVYKQKEELKLGPDENLTVICSQRVVS